jgi:hypothetical protein
MEKSDIKAKLLDGTISALSIDTCIFDQAGHKLEQGIFKQLEQFHSGDFHLIFPEITIREVSAHLTEKTEQALSSLKKGLGDMVNYWLISDDQKTTTLSQFTGDNDHVAKAAERLDTFLKRCNAKVIPPKGHVDVDNLLDLYFSPKAPFENKKDKKNEFPDAIALMTLETWAQKNRTMVLLVTKDIGCTAYCNTSQYLAAIDDLNEALSLIQERNEHLTELCDSIMQNIMDGKYLDLEESIMDEVFEQIEFIDWHIQADSQFLYESDIVHIALPRVTIQTKRKLRPVRYQDDGLVASLSVTADIRLTGHFNFFTQDYVDRDMVNIGSADIGTKTSISLDILLTFENPESSALPTISLLEVVPSRQEIDFGAVGPDYSDENPYHEKY